MKAALEIVEGILSSVAADYRSDFAYERELETVADMLRSAVAEDGECARRIRAAREAGAA